MLVPHIQREHHLNELGPLRLPIYPPEIAVRPWLNLVDVGGKEAVQGVTGGQNINLLLECPHRTTIKIRLELTMSPWCIVRG